MVPAPSRNESTYFLLHSDPVNHIYLTKEQNLQQKSQIKQKLTPKFVHHCLGACERTHATIAAKLTPLLNVKRNNWDKILPSVTFAMNISVNSIGY